MKRFNAEKFSENIEAVAQLHPEVLDRNHPISEALEHVLTKYPELGSLPDGFELAWRLALAYSGQKQP